MNKLKKVFLPAIIVVAAIGTAFATNIAKQSQTIVNGHLYDNVSGECIDKKVKCLAIPGTTCTWMDANNEVRNLQFFNGTSCTFELAKP